MLVVIERRNSTRNQTNGRTVRGALGVESEHWMIPDGAQFRYAGINARGGFEWLKAPGCARERRPRDTPLRQRTHSPLTNLTGPLFFLLLFISPLPWWPVWSLFLVGTGILESLAGTCSKEIRTRNVIDPQTTKLEDTYKPQNGSVT